MIPFFDTFGALLLGTVFVALLWLQWRHPLRRQHLSTGRRIARNFLFSLPAFAVLRLALLPIPLATSVWIERHHVGVLHWLPLPPLYEPWINGVLGIILFDYCYYWWHVATHRVPLLWRFHNVHHTDLDMDVSTAVRFHFGELLLSVFFRVAVVAVFGMSFWTLVVFEILFECAGQFHHSNWRLPVRVERLLNFLIVTPRMHGIHHSIVKQETDSNWGTIFAWWDKLHRTAKLDVPQDALTIGVPAYRKEDELTVGQLWTMPFKQQRE